MIKKILIGVDDSKYAEAAAKYGFNLAESLNAHVGLVNIIEPVAISTPIGDANGILGTPLYGLNAAEDENIINAQTQVSESIIENIIKKYSGKMQVSHYTEYGSRGEGILNCSREFKADIIVIGTHNRSGLDRLFSSNVAEYVVKHSVIPVLVVPTKE
ncbi:universal stress protein [Mucilaginibacter sp. E4BP6]|uniref:universal stress protein n=1 Tax=Mucilaginibacter sp. E4BP6 TaxID=2723089 RepID=UPI0015C7FD5A|nr:universal stress protein [Mucilaginibacter sp. E4BP6]NYE66744.1 nucleotide-binding universal stress UspA family protein [Mucilaginibacter sp. E4BP6]